MLPGLAKRLKTVALRKESVDRNVGSRAVVGLCLVSLSARRAWIEIRCLLVSAFTKPVALRKESVDRNYSFGISGVDTVRRSPQGERG